jgi:exo-beta-1,3-glucanase (GH17 family)
MKVFQGIFNIGDLDNAVNTIVAAVGGDWSVIHTVSVGNELVNGGQASVGTVTAAVANARSKLRAAGYTGPVVTTDTLVATLANPALCDASDYCAVNSHPFFDPNTSAENAGAFLTREIANLKSKLANSNQQIMITETGWPSKGDANGQAVPSSENQSKAIASIKAAFSSNPGDVLLFSPYNMHWKQSNSAQFNAEPWWGFLGDCPSG